MCNCITMTNQSLIEKSLNTQINLALSLTGGVNRILVSTSKIDSKVKKGPINLIASYCPFCGEKYKDGG